MRQPKPAIHLKSGLKPSSETQKLNAAAV